MSNKNAAASCSVIIFVSQSCYLIKFACSQETLQFAGTSCLALVQGAVINSAKVNAKVLRECPVCLTKPLS